MEPTFSLPCLLDLVKLDVRYNVSWHVSLQIVGLPLVGRPETQISRCASLQWHREELEGLK